MLLKIIKLDDSKKLTEQITEDEVKNWNDSKIVLDCPTGMGKTTLINQFVAKVSEGRVLFLSSRTALTEQQLKNLKNLGVTNMEVKTYQWLENLIKQRKTDTINKFYDFIVADECHYFTNDATFNDSTAISYKWIEEQPTVIYMSATGETIFKYMRDNNKVDLYYYADHNYSEVATITFCHSDEHMIQCIEDVYNSDEKMIVFMDKLVRNGELGTKIHTSLMQWFLEHKDDAHFICSKHNKIYDKINEFETAIVDGHFKKQFLFTTQALEVGIDIHDKDCKHVMVEMFDVDSVIQALGRIRDKKNVHYYIRVYDKRTLHGKAMTLKNDKLNKVKEFRQLKTVDERWNFCRNGKGNFDSNDGLFYVDIFDEKKDIKINELMEYKYNDIFNQYMSAIESGEDGQYSKHPHVNRWMRDFIHVGNFKGQFIDMGLIDEENGTNEIKDYLEKLVDIPLNKEQRQMLIEKLNVRGKDGELRKTIKPINEWLMKNKFNYVIESKRLGKERNTVWIIKELD